MVLVHVHVKNVHVVVCIEFNYKRVILVVYTCTSDQSLAMSLKFNYKQAIFVIYVKRD